MDVLPNDIIYETINSNFIGADIARTADIPTKTSQLTNDSGFATSSAIPTKTSQLTNDSDFVTSTELSVVAFNGSYNDLTNKPTITNVSGVNDGTNWTSLTIGSDTYGLGGGGSGGASYTFTNGLTETNGTVTNDLYKAIRVPNSRGNVVLGYNENGEDLNNIADVNSSQGCLVVTNTNRSS